MNSNPGAETNTLSPESEDRLRKAFEANVKYKLGGLPNFSGFSRAEAGSKEPSVSKVELPPDSPLRRCDKVIDKLHEMIARLNGISQFCQGKINQKNLATNNILSEANDVITDLSVPKPFNKPPECPNVTPTRVLRSRVIRLPKQK